MNAVAAPLDQLHEDLASLRRALDSEDFVQAGEVLASHDRRLREYIETVGQQAPLQALRELLELQHRIQSDMSAAREQAATALRGLRQSGQASHSYRQSAR
ncbi:hypothetical protein [Pseudoxanthomonas broegbernensis]|uniref:hypothetical protein n=1 Tax=Pseudoxanthomonas broegbernensis TaxID=83619 RepID=UPI00160F5C5D|nr:hypothetical protein [Pseudoxanthomonas broegbernensis]MBB6065964.1 hypothetical protein [Pseudoxanthomonas broegbernensis]